MKLNREFIRAQIDLLIRAFPELLDDEILRVDMIEGSTDLIAFLRELERMRQDAAALSLGINSTIANLQERRERINNREQGFRKAMRDIMQDAGVKRAELPEATLSIRAGIPRVLILDEMAISDDLCRFRREPDKTKIKEQLDCGIQINGAALSNSESVLSIRTK